MMQSKRYPETVDLRTAEKMAAWAIESIRCEACRSPLVIRYNFSEGEEYCIEQVCKSCGHIEEYTLSRMF